MNFWNKIYEKSDKLMQPVILDARQAFKLHLNDLGDLFKGYIKDSSPGKMNFFRGYYNGLEDYSLADKFIECDFNSKKLSIHITEFFNHTDKKGLIINGGLQWSDKLQKFLIPHSKAITKIYKDETIEIDFTVFMGNYDVTPFGAHVDDDNHRTIVFNLGPGNKCIAVWNNQAIYQQFGKVTNIINPEIISSLPNKYTFKPGEAFVLPSSQFHAGFNSDLSVTAVIVVSLVNEKKAALDMMNALLPNNSPVIDEELRNLSINELIAINKRRLQSNNFLKYSLCRNEKISETINIKKNFNVNAGFNLQIYKLEKTCILMSLGYQIVTPYKPRIIELGQAIKNEKNEISVIVKTLASYGYQMKDIVEIIKFLFVSNSIGVIL